MPSLENSNTPGLLGLKSLRENRALLDTVNNKLYFVGPGDFQLEKLLPEGTMAFPCEYARSGHMCLPCCEYSGKIDKTKLTLYARQPIDITDQRVRSGDLGRGRTSHRSQSADQHRNRSESSTSDMSRVSYATAPPMLSTSMAVHTPR